MSHVVHVNESCLTSQDTPPEARKSKYLASPLGPAAAPRTLIMMRLWMGHVTRMISGVIKIIHIFCKNMNESATPSTGWHRLIECLKLQVIFCKRATNYRALLRKMTYQDEPSYASSPPCTWRRPCALLRRRGPSSLCACVSYDGDVTQTYVCHDSFVCVI